MRTIYPNDKSEYRAIRRGLISRSYKPNKTALFQGRKVVLFEKVLRSKLRRLLQGSAVFFALIFSCGCALRSKKIREWKAEALTGKKVIAVHSFEKALSAAFLPLKKTEQPEILQPPLDVAPQEKLKQEEPKQEEPRQEDPKRGEPHPGDAKELLEKIRSRVISLYPGEWSDFTPLQKASLAGDLHTCQCLLAEGAEMNETSFCKVPPLFLAAISGNVELCLYLFPHALDDEQIEFIFCIAPSFRRDLHRFLKQREEKELVLAGSILFLFDKGEREEALRLYEEASLDELGEILDLFYLFDEYFFEMDDIFNALYDVALPEARGYRDKEGNSFMHRAIQENRQKMIAALLAKGFDLKIVNKKGRTPFEYAITRKEVMRPDLYQKLSDLDGDFTFDLKNCRLFGHFFSLKGPHFEGFRQSEILELPTFIVTTLKHLTLNQPGRFSKERVRRVANALKLASKDPKDILRSLQENGMALIFHGWERHAVTSILSSELFVKIDTGTGEHRGLDFYLMGNRDPAILEKAIGKLIRHAQDLSPEWQGSHYFKKKLDKKLFLQTIGLIPFEQEAGNCGWRSLQGALFALFVIEEMGQNPASAAEIKRAAEAIMNDFWSFIDDYYESIIGIVLPLMRKYPELFDLKELFPQLIQVCLKEPLKRSLIAFVKAEESLKDWKCPDTGKSLLQLCYEKRRYNAFYFLAHEGCDLDAVDNAGRTIHDDLKKELPSSDEETFRRCCQIAIPRKFRKNYET